MTNLAHDLCRCGQHRGTDTQSPFWLDLNGQWVHLQGVEPSYSISKDRPRSEFVSLGGYRYAQQARKASREWNLSFAHASPEAVAALEIAAQFGGPVRLWDQGAAAANAVCPEDVQGSGSAGVLMAGDMPLKTYPSNFTRTVGVKPGETYLLSVWSTAEVIGTYRVGDSGQDTAMHNSAGSGVRRYVSSPILVPEGVDEVEVKLSATAGQSAGLMVTLGDVEPCRFVAGQCAMATVSVEDPQESRTMIPRPGSKAFGEWSVKLSEVC